MAGVLSAHGISRAALQASRSLPVMQMWKSDTARRFASQIAELTASARAELVGAGAEDGLLAQRLSWSLRYRGSDTELLCRDEEDFEDQHKRLFGVLREDHPIEAVWLRIDVWEEQAAELRPAAAVASRQLGRTDALDVRPVGFVDSEGGLRQLETPLFDRGQLIEGDYVLGPALVSSSTTTVLVDPGWSLSVGSAGVLHLRVESVEGELGQGGQRGHLDANDPVRLELAHRRFQSIVTRMGELLRRVAWSTNIKERLDFSCALFDATGELISNAPHIPVHLGAMGATVRHLLERDDLQLRAHQAWAVNDPAAGGSHLPDITVITPLFFGAGRPHAFVACRAHHADVGGTTPGSMPPFSRSLAEEGVLLDGVLLVDQSGWRQESIHGLLTGGPYPVRRPDDCIADLQAQVAANNLGAELLENWVERAGLGVLLEDMSAIQDNAAMAVQSWLQQLRRGDRRFRGSLDDGSPVCVALSVIDESTTGRSRLRVDFAGTGPALQGNLNAPAAVVRAAVLYVVRVLIGRDIPLGDGCLRDVDICVPKGSLLDPPRDAAVVGGNVETSQRVVDVLLAALGVCAASQGTMNNLCFGAADLAYYETICGGSGAGPGQAGDDAVHSHMTNTRITDVEVLEQNFPVVLREFSVRRGSGGAGRWRGGRGVRRVFQFGSRLQVSLLAQRRFTAPFGLAGGGPGSSGISLLRRAGSQEEEMLSGSFEETLEVGDVLVIETPGAGGYGSA